MKETRDLKRRRLDRNAEEVMEKATGWGGQSERGVLLAEGTACV